VSTTSSWRSTTELADGSATGPAAPARRGEVVGGSPFMADRAALPPMARLMPAASEGWDAAGPRGRCLGHCARMRAFHLGGGTSGADSLYDFKRAGGDEHTTFATVVVTATT
jgi:hypothetical protein